MKRNNGFTLIELMIVVAILGILVSVAIPKLLPFIRDYSDGVRVGEMVKLSQKGMVWKTMEGQIKVSESGTLFDFSIDRQNGHGEDSSDLIKTIGNSYGKKVKIRYIQRRLMPWRAETDYLVQEIQIIQP